MTEQTTTPSGDAEVVRHRTLWLERRAKDVRDALVVGGLSASQALAIGAGVSALELLAAEARDDDATDARLRAEPDVPAPAPNGWPGPDWSAEMDRLRLRIAELEGDLADAGEAIGEQASVIGPLQAVLEAGGRPVAELERIALEVVGSRNRLRTELARALGLALLGADGEDQDGYLLALLGERLTVADGALARAADREARMDAVLTAARAVCATWEGGRPVADHVTTLGRALDALGVAEPDPTTQDEQARASAVRAAFAPPPVPTPAEVFSQARTTAWPMTREDDDA